MKTKELKYWTMIEVMAFAMAALWMTMIFAGLHNMAGIEELVRCWEYFITSTMVGIVTWGANKGLY